MQILKPLRHGPIARLWAGLSLAAIGDQVYRIALIWLSVELAGAEAGWVSTAEAAAVLFTALFAGAWTERWDHRRTMIGADLVRAVLALVPLIAWATGQLTLWTLLIPSVALAALRGVFEPALQASLPRLAPTPGLLTPTNALMDATARLARLVGPTLAGALAAILPTAGLMAVTALTSVASAVAILSLRRDLPRQTHDTHGSRLDLLLRGFRAIRGRSYFRYLLWRGGVVNGLWVVALWLSLPLAVQRGGLEAFGVKGLAVVGLVMGAYGVGNVTSNLIVGGLPIRAPVAMILAGNGVVGVGLALMGWAALAAPPAMVVPLMMAASAITALGGPLSDVPMAILRQTVFPLYEVAAVYRLSIVFDWGGMLIATALAPLLLQVVSPSGAILLCGTGIVAVALAGLTQPSAPSDWQAATQTS
ncbi:MAG: MFS transporter [Alphaproteobacteria bacterium]|nr:MFS transporter [Alphaproteobacteria bacterium]MBU1514369.1 MFS transporter [Alphaproteobacteria bacterium]MBU2096013.1 MFS transporter [Alphaproteobacteria bacterium]MBU2150021.1 MFS transporter [Alphaproteobacteria bacterium]MBU2308568.1 MFS transporter [Alphaproteobacteria bacterium]